MIFQKYSYIILKLSKKVCVPLSTPLPGGSFRLSYKDFQMINHCKCAAIQAFVTDWLNLHFHFYRYCVTLKFPLSLSRLTTEHLAFIFLYFTVIGVYKSSHPLWTVRTLPFPLSLSLSLCWSLLSTNTEVQCYSSVREREMRGPFLISFLFSSFLLLFSSSLRIFWKASAVWSTWWDKDPSVLLLSLVVKV